VKHAIVTALLFAAACSWAQTSADTTYRVEVTATAGPMFNFFRLPKVPGTSSKTSIGYGISVRGMWHPARLLAVGFLTGYFLIAEDEILIAQPSSDPNYDATLAAVPIQMALSMQKAGFEFGMGIGPYMMMSAIGGGLSASVHGSRLELGMTFFASYGFALGENISLGPELRVVSLRYRGIVSVMPSLSFRIDPVRY
jgi:hypothetical protein